jgi:hypothetical protein
MDKNRRNFLKISLIGGGALFLGKIFGSDLMNLFSKSEKVTDFNNFRIEENDKELVIYGKSGEAIFIIDKEQ